VANPRPEEAAKFRSSAGATRSILLGPAFGGDASLDDELRAHAVALWVVDDLIAALEAQIGPDEMRPMLEPGRSEAARLAILWEREHGRRKRVAVIADRLARAAWKTQVMLASTVAIDETPALTEETLFVLVDEALAEEGIVTGARFDEVREAIAFLAQVSMLKRNESGCVALTPSHI
jgi:hypothetical protein